MLAFSVRSSSARSSSAASMSDMSTLSSGLYNRLPEKGESERRNDDDARMQA